MEWLNKLRYDWFPTKREKRFQYLLYKASRKCLDHGTGYAIDVAWAYVKGDGVDQSKDQAMYWFKRATEYTYIYEGGDPHGMHELFYWYYHGHNRFERRLQMPVSYVMAVHWGEKYMSTRPYADEIDLTMANIYAHGREGVNRDVRRAIKIFRFLGHAEGFVSGRVRESGYYPELKGFTDTRARRMAWCLETQTSEKDAPDWFLESKDWYSKPSGKAKRNASGYLFCDSYEQWGPPVFR